ncbi:MAG: GNAT family N-acetyltransferase [Nannocystaceae bacterium]|nr:GNAT family N-acetyltransferase [Nannocystaceae bacterium]
MTTVLVPLTEDTLDRFAAMVEQMYLDDPSEQPMSRERARHQAARMLHEDRGLALPMLVHADGQTVGYVIVVPFLSNEFGGRIAVLDEVFVMPSLRGRGHGTAAIQAAVAWARERGFRFVMLEVNDRNVRARALYQRLGFVAQARRTMSLPL